MHQMVLPGKMSPVPDPFGAKLRSAGFSTWLLRQRSSAPPAPHSAPCPLSPPCPAHAHFVLPSLGQWIVSGFLSVCPALCWEPLGRGSCFFSTCPVLCGQCSMSPPPPICKCSHGSERPPPWVPAAVSSTKASAPTFPVPRMQAQVSPCPQTDAWNAARVGTSLHVNTLCC